VSAKKFGYENVYILPAGIAGWKKANKPIET
jgi:rhodanese-related sulfurtransferase